MKEELLKEEGTPVLRKEIIYVKPNLRNPGWVKSPSHRAYFLMDKAKIILYAPRQRNGQIKDVLTKAEKDFFEDLFGMEKNAMSVHKKTDNFWHDFKVTLDKDVKILDLESPVDYISWKVLLAHNDFVAPDFKSVRNKATYKFYLEKPADAAKAVKEEASKTTRVWTTYGEVSKDLSLMLDYLNVIAEINGQYRNKISGLNKDSSLDLVSSTLVNIIQEQPELWLALYKNEDIELMMLINKAVEQGLVQRKGGSYFDKGASKAFASSFKDAVKVLKNPEYQDFRSLLENTVK